MASRSARPRRCSTSPTGPSAPGWPEHDCKCADISSSTRDPPRCGSSPEQQEAPMVFDGDDLSAFDRELLDNLHDEQRARGGVALPVSPTPGGHRRAAAVLISVFVAL